MIDEYGTAATTIRAFYDALGDGQGGNASAMVVPEKRTRPAFAPENMTRFYGSLADPIRLIDIAQENANTFIVNYHYATKSSGCNGRVCITTTMRDGRNYIQGIRALNGCQRRFGCPASNALRDMRDSRLPVPSRCWRGHAVFMSAPSGGAA
ncbi:hypothetical protein [Komagataeibacter sp. FXV3]|uniref:hypothetical protein n=1 Tax=Komagataeibacter sp. FXV3 TaxID=2608998 RepID=UPI001D110A98|nr:hypothetical protein [Komagataeibacter sp. FXV3]